MNSAVRTLDIVKQADHVFPFTLHVIPEGKRNVVHDLQRKAGEFKSFTFYDRYKQLQNTQEWKDTVKKWKTEIAAGRVTKPNANDGVKYAMVKVRDIAIDDDIQRALDAAWVAKIFNYRTFSVPYMEMCDCVLFKGQFISIDVQHTTTGKIGMFAEGILEGADDSECDKTKEDWILDLKIPVQYVEIEKRSIGRMKFRIKNGKNKKQISKMHDHRILVLSYRCDQSPEDEDYNAHVIQQINEEEGYEPVEADSPFAKEVWALLCIAEMQSNYTKPDRWRFVLRTHRRYFHYLQLDTCEVDLWGFIYDYYTQMGVDVYSESFTTKFLDKAVSIIWDIWRTPKAFDSDCAEVQLGFHSALLAKPKDDKTVKNKKEAMGPFYYLLKLVRYFEVDYKLPVVVDNMDGKLTGDLLKYVVKPELILRMKNFDNNKFEALYV